MNILVKGENNCIGCVLKNKKYGILFLIKQIKVELLIELLI